MSIKENICNYQQFHDIGNKVYYKRDSSHEWKGPAKVLGQDGAVLFLRHGAKYIKVHICRVQLTHTNPRSHLENNNIESQQTNPETLLSSVHDNPAENAVESSEDEIEYESSSNVNNEHETNKNNLKTTKNITSKPNHLIKFTDDKNVEYEATVINRAGKASGKYNSCYNIKYQNPTEFTGKISWIDLRNVNDLIVIPEAESSNNIDLSENLLEKNNISNNTENKQHTTQNTKEDYSNYYLCFQKAKEKVKIMKR